MNDSCPECLARDVKPDRTRESPVTIVALYRCRSCGHEWDCSWDVAALGPDDIRNAAATVVRRPSVTTT